ncbi:hypothetical protein [Streptomyces viridochromogenes]|uniref:hypothetical protein n=1 Tax=Streptomyces viridochromogenes TaxID=1938 RepID=UPI00058670FB|nr:hypothetical protein [Streptomyces viridochromogenes]
MRDESLPVAEGARQTLVEVAGYLSFRQIAALAHRALREIHLAPSPDRLDFGLVPRGSPSQEKSVTLQGPPLARHCVAQPAQPWLRVEPAADGLRVHVDTAAEGRLSGEITLKGVADEAVIHVEAVVGPAHESAPPAGPDVEAPPRPPRQRVPGQGAHDQETAIVEPPPSRPPAREPATPPPSAHTPATSPPSARRPATSPPSARRPATSPPPGRKPPTSPPPRTRTPARGQTRPLAPALAGTALALAVTAVITLVIAVQAAAVAVAERSDEGVDGNIEDNLQAHGAFTPLILSLITAALALVVGVLARRELGQRRDLYSERAAGGTRTLTSVAKGLAIPVLVLAVLMGIAYLVGSGSW